MLSKESFIKASCTVWGVYAVQMLATPKMLTESHFHDASTPLSVWLTRATSCSAFAAIAAVLKLETAEAYKIVLPWIVATGLLYPWSAKLGLFSEVKPKYPIHYVPETLFVILPAMGLLAGM